MGYSRLGGIVYLDGQRRHSWRNRSKALEKVTILEKLIIKGKKFGRCKGGSRGYLMVFS